MRARKLVPLLWVIAFMLGARLLIQQLRHVDERAHGFVVYYTSARLLAEGADPARFYDEKWFEVQVGRFEPTVRDIYWANPPNMSLLLLPLSGLSYRSARAFWLVLGFALFSATCMVLVRQLRLHPALAPAFVAFAYVYAPLEDNLFHGQVYALALVLVTVAFLGYRERRDARLGLPLGVLLALKTAALPMWLLLVVQRRWRALTIGVVCAGAISVAALPWIGPGAWARYAREFIAVPGRPALAVTAYQTLFSFSHHAVGLLRVPMLASIVTALTGLTLVGLTAWIAHRRGCDERVFAAFVLLSLVVTPVTSEPHWVLALLPVCILVADLPLRSRTYLVLLLVGAFLLGSSLPYRSARLADGWLSLFAYPRLAGALLLWCLALWSAGRNQEVVSQMGQTRGEGFGGRVFLRRASASAW